MMGPKEECEKLMDVLLPFALQMLERYGEFYPFGGMITRDGKIVQIGAMDDDMDHPKSQPLIDTMVSTFREKAKNGDCRATGIVVDVKVVPPDRAEKVDAIQLRMDHHDGYSVEVFFPYERRGKNIEVQPAFASKGSSLIFEQVQ